MPISGFARILLGALALTAAAFASVPLAPSGATAAGSVTGVVNRRGYPKLAILRSGGPPSNPSMVESLHRNFAMADLIVFGGARGKWWPLPTDASGLTLRAYNRKMKILEYLSTDIFPTDPPTGAEIVPPPTDPEAALHTRTFTREQYYALARALGSLTSYPTYAPLDPKWAGVIQKTDYNGRYATWVFANWKSRVFRDYVKAAMAEVAAAGFNGMFFDFGSINPLSTSEGFWFALPPDCFRLKSSGYWYWMSQPGQRFEGLGAPPTLESLQNMDPAALDAVQDLDFCSLTGQPAEYSSQEDVEATIIDFYREMREASRLLLVWNGAHPGSGRRNQVALVNSNGAHEEGYGLMQWTPQQIRADFDMVEIFNTNRKIFIGWNRESSAQGLIYGYVACMIPGGPNTYCEFSEQIPGIPEIQLDPGTPRGHYVTVPAGETDLDRIVYKRSFSKAVMYLNPTSTDITVDGITIGAKTGRVIPPPPKR